LRDLAGLIVIDFIDMDESNNNRAVERKLKDCLRLDRARIQVGRISHFGLLEMSRQRMRSGVLEGSTIVCPHCMGMGVIRSVESMALRVLRDVEAEAVKGRATALTAKAPVDVTIYILNQKRSNLLNIEERYGISVYIEAESTLKGSEHRIEQTETRSLLTRIPSIIENIYKEEEKIEEVIIEQVCEARDIETHTEAQSDDQGLRRRRRRRRKKKNEEGSVAIISSDEIHLDDICDDEDDAAHQEVDIITEDEVENDNSDEEDRPRKRRRRGRRGGRRNRRDADDQSVIEANNNETKLATASKENREEDGKNDNTNLARENLSEDVKHSTQIVSCVAVETENKILSVDINVTKTEGPKRNGWWRRRSK
jgi:ribonuclease E